ncbi:uncharacterized protein LOC131990185 [Centropristis striata]|uniref:uncharacterized protein LOC131990185 n=1 Tax=Centropristis striata TaxID=184440 RepID=UPI0027E009F7|nr:uncharacterized protein LOC131990185 [Centropristis striata]
MDESNKRIVILGKPGIGKSSLANTIFGEKRFRTYSALDSETNKCQRETKSVNGRRITLIDTPGYFDTDRPEEELKAEIVRCITECSPGPHAFLIVLKVEKFTEQEQDVITKIKQLFSEEVYKYATVLFTHGDQLSDGQTIMEFVHQNQLLSDVVKKCGGRCHVVDNKYWKNDQQDEYRSNKFQMEELLKTIDEITEANRGGCYTNEMLQAAEEMIQQEEERIRKKSSPNMSEEEIREQAKVSTFKKLWIKLAGIATGALLGALLGMGVAVVVMVLRRGAVPTLKAAAAGGAAVGAVMGSVTGYQAAENADINDGLYFLSVSDTKRIVILGKTGAGKSSVANTIFGEELFKIGDSAKSETRECQAGNKSVNGRRITLIDTPGFFDTDRPEEELKAEIVKCITECSPGPHAFLIVLKVERFTKQEQAVIDKIKAYFSEEVFKYATLLFTHGDELREGQKIMEFVRENNSLSDLVEKCGGRCHVIDNKYWKNDQQDEYRSNKFQVEELLKTIDEITEANRGGYYTNEMLQAAEEMIQQEEECIRKSSPKMSKEEIRKKAKVRTAKTILIRLAGFATGAVLGALFGLLGNGCKGAGAVAAAIIGAVSGGISGYFATEGAGTPLEAAENAAKAAKYKSPSTRGEEKYALDRLNRFKPKQS